MSNPLLLNDRYLLGNKVELVRGFDFKICCNTL